MITLELDVANYIAHWIYIHGAGAVVTNDVINASLLNLIFKLSHNCNF